MPIGEYGASEVQLKRGVEQRAEQKSSGLFGSLVNGLRREREPSFTVEYYKLQYAKKLMNAQSREELNSLVNKRLTALELLVVRGKVEGQGTRDAIEALADHAHRLPAKDMWKVLTLTLEEKNPKLRIAPDLARALLLSGSPDYAVRKYKEEARELGNKARISYRANSISYFREDGTPKEGPEHFVPLVESEIDWATGLVTGKHLFYMLRYERDTCVNGVLGAVANPLFKLRPTPEYDGIGFRFAVGSGSELSLTEIELRAHWIAFRLPIELAARTSDGRIKVTAVPDSEHTIWGHMILVVTKNPMVALSTIRKLNPQIDMFYLKTFLRNPSKVKSEVYLWEELPRAEEYWMKGKRYAVRGRLVMLESGIDTDPTSAQLIAGARVNAN